MSNRLLESGDELLTEGGSFRLLEELAVLVGGLIDRWRAPQVESYRDPRVTTWREPQGG